MPKLNTTTSGIITATLTADSSPTLDLQENGVTFRTLGQSQLVSGIALTASGTSVDFSGIPSWAKRVTVMFNGVSTNGTSVPQIQLGTSGGVQTTGYLMTASTSSGVGTSNALYTSGFGLVGAATAAANVFGGFVSFTLLDLANGIWACSGVVGFSNVAAVTQIGGSKALSGTLDRVRITTVNGTDTFDAGTINIMWE